jgi:hypothetical protein
MTTQAEYFSANRYKPQYFLGDRVRGLYHGIPFAGSVDIDTKIHEDGDPYVIVHLDLPIKLDNVVLNMIKVTHKDLIDLKDSYESNRKVHRKRSVVGNNRRSK